MTLVTYCPECGARLVGAVDTLLHYQSPGHGGTPCERRQREQRRAQSDEGSS